MTKAIRILLQTTVPGIEDDWNIERFSLLRARLASVKDERGKPLFDVTARNRDMAAGDAPVLSVLDAADIDELWPFGVDPGNGLTAADCRGISRFRERGRGILATRDHQDMGSSLCTLGGIGRAHYFHSRHQDTDESRHVPDDEETKTISWPNYHSGNNGTTRGSSASSQPTRCSAILTLLLGRLSTFPHTRTKAAWASRTEKLTRG